MFRRIQWKHRCGIAQACSPRVLSLSGLPWDFSCIHTTPSHVLDFDISARLTHMQRGNVARNPSGQSVAIPLKCPK